MIRIEAKDGGWDCVSGAGGEGGGQMSASHGHVVEQN
jgi:hypothetical protein